VQHFFQQAKIYELERKMVALNTENDTLVKRIHLLESQLIDSEAAGSVPGGGPSALISKRHAVFHGYKLGIGVPSFGQKEDKDEGIWPEAAGPRDVNNPENNTNYDEDNDNLQPPAGTQESRWKLSLPSFNNQNRESSLRPRKSAPAAVDRVYTGGSEDSDSVRSTPKVSPPIFFVTSIISI